jgi:hypothetical protein
MHNVLRRWSVAGYILFQPPGFVVTQFVFCLIASSSFNNDEKCMTHIYTLQCKK